MIQSDLLTEPGTPPLQAARAAHAPAHERPTSRPEAKSEAKSGDNARRAPLAFAQLPFMKRDDSGRPLKGIAIDYWAYTSNTLLISGWISGGELDNELPARIARSPGVTVSLFRRPDVETTFSTRTVGLLALVSLSAATSFDVFGFRLALPDRRENDRDCSAFLTEHRERFGFLLDNLTDDCPERALIARQLPAAPETYKGARGFLEQAKGVPGHGGITVGWAVNLPNVRLKLLDQSGRLHPLDHAIRWHRPDIVQGLGQDFGNYTFNAGLLQGWRHPFQIGDEIQLVAFDGEAAFMLATRRWDAAPVEPASFARWAFELPTPVDRFTERLEHHDGPIIETLVARDRQSWRKAGPEMMHTFGSLPESPKCSIIVPLYGRFDFMLNQLLEFSEDTQIRQHAELIYVVDDPRIASDAIQQAPLLHESYRVPFRIVVSPENRGFAGANNLGVSVSRAPALLLLNSDVIPVEAGWLTRMLEALNKNAKVGIVGARLFFPNGSIQHDGMVFQWEPTWQTYLNKHPRSGMDASNMPAKGTSEPAVSGACLLIRKSTYEEVGGLDENFLVGDFEDSDLCLKVRQRALGIVCCRDINLTHLERQSFAHIGADDFRQRVVHYNAWRHHRRWSDYIDTLMTRQKAGAAT
jgi:GT2 family glycosyltransferase